MACAVLLGLGRMLCVSFMMSMFFRAINFGFMGMSCKGFCSHFLMKIGRGHTGRHGIAHPAAQGQQNDHEGE